MAAVSGTYGIQPINQYLKPPYRLSLNILKFSSEQLPRRHFEDHFTGESGLKAWFPLEMLERRNFRPAAARQNVC